MSNLENILSVTDSSEVTLAESFKELLHKELTFGMTRYVCRYGTLSDGHEKITESQRYYQALREAYNRAQTMKEYKAQALEAQADLIEAQETLDFVTMKPQVLRAQAAHIKATAKLQNALVMAEDCNRQLGEFLKVVKELQASVRAKYPEGIEQAELDNWKATTRYRAAMQEIKGTPLHLEHLPLPQKEKAQLALDLNKAELAAWFMTEHNTGKTPKEITEALTQVKQLK